MKRMTAIFGVAALLMMQAAPAAYAADPRVVCKGDYQRYCNGVTPGGGRLTKCFKDNASNLSKRCLQSLAEAKAKHDKEVADSGQIDETSSQDTTNVP